MSVDMEQALAWAASRDDGVLITIRKDGRPQSSDITYASIDGTFVISLTASRAKTVNLRRDPRAVLHVTHRDSWSYLSFDGVVELLAPAAATDDGTCDALVAYYEQVTGGPHPDWDEYRQAMVTDQRLLAYFRPSSVVGQIHL